MVDKRFKKELNQRNALKSSKSKEERNRAWGKGQRSMSFCGTLPRAELVSSDSSIPARANTSPMNISMSPVPENPREDKMDEDDPCATSPSFDSHMTSPVKLVNSPRLATPGAGSMLHFKVTGATGASNSAPTSPLTMMRRKYKSENSLFGN
jgi:hypothetical protein